MFDFAENMLRRHFMKKTATRRTTMAKQAQRAKQNLCSSETLRSSKGVFLPIPERKQEPTLHQKKREEKSTERKAELVRIFAWPNLKTIKWISVS